jgi:hypothetical protein
MRTLALVFGCSAAALGDPCLEAVKQAIGKTIPGGYVYEVKGKYERSGEFVPEAVLTSRIKQYQSIRNGERILVKGPEGLWRTPEERLGEKVEKPDPEASAIVRVLEETEPPHTILERALTAVGPGSGPEDREVNGFLCQRYVFPLRTAPLKEYLEQHLEKAIKAGTVPRPDEVRWTSTMKGTLAVYIDRKDGRLVRIRDDRSVKIAYKPAEGQADLKTYKLEMEFDFSSWGQAKAAIPREVREKLGLPASKD